MFAKCDALPKGDLFSMMDMCAKGIHSRHSFLEFQASTPPESRSTLHQLCMMVASCLRKIGSRYPRFGLQDIDCDLGYLTYSYIRDSCKSMKNSLNKFRAGFWPLQENIYFHDFFLWFLYDCNICFFCDLDDFQWFSLIFPWKIGTNQWFFIIFNIFQWVVEKFEKTWISWIFKGQIGENHPNHKIIINKI